MRKTLLFLSALIVGLVSNSQTLSITNPSVIFTDTITSLAPLGNECVFTTSTSGVFKIYGTVNQAAPTMIKEGLLSVGNTVALNSSTVWSRFDEQAGAGIDPYLIKQQSGAYTVSKLVDLTSEVLGVGFDTPTKVGNWYFFRTNSSGVTNAKRWDWWVTDLTPENTFALWASPTTTSDMANSANFGYTGTKYFFRGGPEQATGNVVNWAIYSWDGVKGSTPVEGKAYVNAANTTAALRTNALTAFNTVNGYLYYVLKNSSNGNLWNLYRTNGDSYPEFDQPVSADYICTNRSDVSVVDNYIFYPGARLTTPTIDKLFAFNTTTQDFSQISNINGDGVADVVNWVRPCGKKLFFVAGPITDRSIYCYNTVNSSLTKILSASVTATGDVAAVAAITDNLVYFKVNNGTSMGSYITDGTVANTVKLAIPGKTDGYSLAGAVYSAASNTLFAYQNNTPPIIDSLVSFKVNYITGISTQKKVDSEISISPNPVSSMLNINSSLPINSIEIFNLEGKLILNANQKAVNVSSLKNGLYVVKINSANNSVIKRFVKK